MTTITHPGRMLFVTLPVADVERSKAFFGGLGFGFDPRFSDDGGVCMPVGEQAVVMLAGRDRFTELSARPVGDATAHALALYCFSVAERDDVDAVFAAAVAAGATEAEGPEDHGFMYTRAFFDLDGHGWQIMWMAPAEA